MAQALSLHIGLNYVNPAAYDGWDGELSGCINDANAMKRIAESQGFATQTLIDSQATAAAVTNSISSIGRRLGSGDFFLLTYSGHGGQLVDETGEETDGLNETWVLWDRQFIDNEIYNLLAQFSPGVRIFISSDSCHSGTVIRAFLRALKSRKNISAGVDYINEFSRYLETAPREIAQFQVKNVRDFTAVGSKVRSMPEMISIRNYEKNKESYNAVRNLAGGKNARAGDIGASVIFISGCADNQFSYDGATNGAFTGALLQVWNNGGFSGSYPSFHSQIRDRMNNPEQIPQYMKLGNVATSFENAKPYVVGAGSSGGSSSSGSASPVNPSMTAPSPYNRNSTAPVFQVNKGANPYYYVELATDSSLFVYGNTSRTSNNWYATWAERLTAPTWQIPVSAWGLLKNAPRIYYRVGSTSSAGNGWNDLKVSFYDAEVASAPFIELQNSAGSGGTGNSGSNPGGNTNPGSASGNSLSGSVGLGGVNRPEDVALIQQLLNEISDADGGAMNSPLGVDGAYGSMTLNAIRRFQTRQEFVAGGLVKQNSSCLHMMLNKSGREK